MANVCPGSTTLNFAASPMRLLRRDRFCSFSATSVVWRRPTIDWKRSGRIGGGVCGSERWRRSRWSPAGSTGCARNSPASGLSAPWERGFDCAAPGLTEQEAADAVEEVLTLLSFALSVEPQLIRFARRLLDAGRRDPGIEAKIWESDAFLSRHPDGATFLPNHAKRLREGLESQDRRRKEEIFLWVEAFRLGDESNVWDEELVGLQDEVRRGLIKAEKLERAVGRLEAQRRKIVATKGGAEPSKFLEAWHRWVLGRTLPPAWGEAGRVLHEIWAIVHRDDPRAVPPAAANAAWLVDTSVATPDQPERLFEILDVSGRIMARPFRLEVGGVGEPRGNVSPLAPDPHEQGAHQDRAGRRFLGGRRRAGMGRWLGKR